jgi:NAD(P)H-flavin reductase
MDARTQALMPGSRPPILARRRRRPPAAAAGPTPPAPAPAPAVAAGGDTADILAGNSNSYSRQLVHIDRRGPRAPTESLLSGDDAPPPSVATRRMTTTAVRFRVCTSATCEYDGATAVLGDIEALCAAACSALSPVPGDAQPMMSSSRTTCMHACGRGPNVAISANRDRMIPGGIRSHAAACALVESNARCPLPPNWLPDGLNQALQERFDANLPSTPTTDRLHKLQRALGLLDGLADATIPVGLIGELQKQRGVEFSKLKQHLAAEACFGAAISSGGGFKRTAAALARLERMRQRAAGRHQLQGDAATVAVEGAGVKMIGHEMMHSWKLVGCDRVSGDSCIYRFQIDQDHHPSRRESHDSVGGAWHVAISPIVDGQQLASGQLRRLYTPLSSQAEYWEGHLDLLVKSYPQGQMSKHFDALAKSHLNGHEDSWTGGMLISEPRPTALGALSAAEISTLGDTWPVLALVAGGTGILPLLQIARHFLESSQSTKREVRLLLCNRTYNDVLCVPELLELWSSARLEPSAHRPRRFFNVSHALSAQCAGADEDSAPPSHWPADWKVFLLGGVKGGRINEDVMQQALITQPSSGGMLAFCCGSVGFMETATRLMTKVGVGQDAVHCLDT